MDWNNNGNWPLLVGEICGSLVAAGFEVVPVMDGCNYTNQFRIARPSGMYLLTITLDVTTAFRDAANLEAAR